MSLSGLPCIVENALELEQLAIPASIWHTVATPHRTPDKSEVGVQSGSVQLGFPELPQLRSWFAIGTVEEFHPRWPALRGPRCRGTLAIS
jgi:hypothetical protein